MVDRSRMIERLINLPILLRSMLHTGYLILIVHVRKNCNYGISDHHVC